MQSNISIVISSGKGGTGKTFVSTNIACVLEGKGHNVCYLDCDVEEPNGHLFLKPQITLEEDALVFSPVGIDNAKCTACGLCEENCNYNAIAVINKKALLFQDLCHICGACTIVCPEKAIIEQDRVIGTMIHGNSGAIEMHYALLKTGEGGMSPRLIKKVKEYAGGGITILDSPPGTSCPVVETVRGADLCVMVTDPTPFGLHDLKLSVDMCRATGSEPVVLINRTDEEFSPLYDYCRDEGLEVIGEIPDDRAVAECYSVGDMAVDRLPQYREIFQNIADKIIARSREKRPVIKKEARPKKSPDENLVQVVTKAAPANLKSKELVVISGKGGTGKTSLVAAFCALEKNIVISDCDVDAADLHLVLSPEIKERGDFSGGQMAEIDAEKCTGCGECFSQCRFGAIKEVEYQGRSVYQVEEISCEGCGVCSIVCNYDAVKSEVSINGEWYLSETRFGPMSHARLGVAEENSGKLVSLVRNKKNELAEQYGLYASLVDGSPGTGCPVIASITGTDYALVVTEPTVSGLHDLYRVLDVINFFNISAGVIINKADLNPEKAQEIIEMARENNAEILGMIPYDKSITRAQMQGLSVVEYTDSETTQTIRAIWEKLYARVFSEHSPVQNQ